MAARTSPRGGCRSAMRHDVGAGRELRAGPLELVAVAGEQAQPRPFGRQLTREDEAKPARAAGDDDDAPFETDGVPVPQREGPRCRGRAGHRAQHEFLQLTHLSSSDGGRLQKLLQRTVESNGSV